MGIFDNDDLELIETLSKEANSFKPQELDETLINILFSNCLARGNLLNQELEYSYLFSEEYGFVKNQKPIGFNKKTIQNNKQTILYLIGQLQAVHPDTKKEELSFSNSITTYSGDFWTKNEGTLSKFLHLAASPSISAITPFYAKPKSAKLNPDIEPTLSPNDPNFPAWWEEHKSEWEDKKKDGQEPGDD